MSPIMGSVPSLGNGDGGGQGSWEAAPYGSAYPPVPGIGNVKDLAAPPVKVNSTGIADGVALTYSAAASDVVPGGYTADGVRRNIGNPPNGQGWLDLNFGGNSGAYALHLTSNPATGSSGFMIGIGTDDSTAGAAGGILISHKTNQAAGLQISDNPGSAIGLYHIGFSSNWVEYSQVYAGSLGHALYAMVGNGFKDGVAVGTTLSSPLSTGAPITSIPCAALLDYNGNSVSLPANSTLQVKSGANTQTFTVSPAGAAAGATSIPVNSLTPNFAYPAGSAIGSYAIQSATAGFNGFADTLSTALTAGQTGVTALVLQAAIPIALSAGQQVQIVSSGGNDTFTVSPTGASIGATTIPVNSQTSVFAHSTGDTVNSGDIGQKINQTTGISNEDPIGTIVNPCTITSTNQLMDTLSTALTTGQAGVTALVVQTATNVAVSAGQLVSVGGAAGTDVFTVASNTAAGVTTIPVNSKTSTFAHATGVTVNSPGLWATMSNPAAVSGTGLGGAQLRFMVYGLNRTPVAGAQQYLGLYDTDGVTPLFQLLYGSMALRYPTIMHGKLPTDVPLSVISVAGQTADLLDVGQTLGGAYALRVTAGNNVATNFGLLATNAAGLDRIAAQFQTYAAGFHAVQITGVASQTADQLHIQDNSLVAQSRFNKNGVLITRAGVLANADLNNGEVGISFAATASGAQALTLICKDTAGGVHTGTVAMV